MGKSTAGIKSQIQRGASELFPLSPVCETHRFCYFKFTRATADSVLSFLKQEACPVSRMEKKSHIWSPLAGDFVA